MTKRNPFVVFLLTFITIGIYAIYWYIVTAREMRAKGADIPHGILIIIPIANLFWMWKWSEGVEKVTAGKLGGVLAFVLVLALGVIGMAVVQSKFNEAA